MSRVRMKRWVCPNCNSGALAPSRPRKDDVRRYCLACSERTGRLVERTCPSLETARSRREAQRSERAERERERVAAAARRRHVVDLLDIGEEWERLCALPIARTWMSEHGLKRVFFTVAWSKVKDYTTGHAWTGGGAHLGFYEGCTRHEAQALMAHELAHVLSPHDAKHGEVWRRRFALLIVEGYGVDLNSLKPTEGRAIDLDGRVEKELRAIVGDERVAPRERFMEQRAAARAKPDNTTTNGAQNA